MRIHSLETGRLVMNKTFLRGQGWSSLLRPRTDFEFPVHCFLLEAPSGLVAIDTGMTTRVRVPRVQQRFVPRPVIGPEEEIGPRMKAMGLDPQDVRQVIVTHLDWDHVGGVGAFPNADVLVHRPEHEFASTLMGRLRYQPKLWPATFAPTLYDLDPDPYGPFPQSKRLADHLEMRLVPLPGHSIGQVGVIVEAGGATVFFAADHVLRQDWFLEDYGRGDMVGLGIFFPDLAVETTRRVHGFLEDVPAVFVPSHDADGPARLAAGQPVQV